MRRRVFALLLCLAVLLPALPAQAADAQGEIDGWSVYLGQGAALRRSVWWTGDDYRTENYLTLSPGAALTPRVQTNAALCKSFTLADAVKAAAGEGLRTVAAVNGGFFTMATGVPVGLVAADGALRSWSAADAWMRSLGFRADGSALIGLPGISLYLTLSAEEAEEETEAETEADEEAETEAEEEAEEPARLAVASLNQPRGEGLALFTHDITAAAATLAKGDGWNVICAAEGPVPLSGSLALTVEQVLTASGPVKIPEGRMVLSLAGDTEGEAPDWLNMLQTGDTLLLSAVCDETWRDVESAVGLLYMLAEDGAVAGGLEKYKDAAPRTAVGLRADGTLVLYTVDGRQSGHSVGLGLDGVARRMLELGCVTAAALDGGTSTNLNALLPGDNVLSQINIPSDGGRKVVNYILLTTAAKPAGRAARLALYPLDLDLVAGAEAELTVRAVDENGYPAPLPEGIAFTVSDALGTVEKGVFHAEKEGEGTITATAPGVESVSIPVSVVESPDNIYLYGEVYGKLTKSLTLEPGQEVDLRAAAVKNHLWLECADTCFTWELEEDAGEVDETGHLTPAPVSGKGMLRVSAGETETEIPITIWSGVPFRDILTTDERFAAVKYVYDHKLFQGTDDTTFEPDTVMNRGMLVTVLWRMQGSPEAAPASFADVAPEDWYGPAVAWAAERGLVTGYDAETFGPLDELTKEQIITILWRADSQPEPEAPGTDCADAAEISDYARVPMLWALESLIDPTPEGLLLPAGPMTRAAVADVLMRYLK